ncbi:MAG: S-layer homology domain-containing protein [Acidimicrobiaceae bacterium]|nr:S-layer homology domain-containing protein [Acidimicrobiaceae bacterium]
MRDKLREFAPLETQAVLLTCVFVPSTGRSGWAVLAAGALVASLLAVSAGPAGAAEVKAGDDNEASPGNEAPFSACVGDAVEAPDPGFSDVPAGHAFAEVISCIAYYGITNGTGDGSTYSPNADVSRAQMALFLYRAAALMGVDLMGGDDDMMADYSDIGDVWEEAQNAIRALARNGILMGRGMGLFEPAADITRAEMAAALVALLDHTPGAPVHTDDDGLYELVDSDDTAEAPDDWFGDVRASKPRAVDNAVAAAYELGVTQGYSDGTFKPDDSVSRGEMAAFITRTLAHSNLRPAGLTAQVHDATKVTVSVRDADFAPVVNQAVDLFRAAAADEDRAFTAAGKCSGRTHPFEDLMSGKCEIDGADPVTQSDGNVELTLGGDVGDGQTVWVWHGELGDKADAETDFVKVSIVKGAAPRVDAEKVAVTTSLAMVGGEQVERAHFGATVTVTIQMRGAADDGKEVDAAPDPDKAPVKYSVLIEEYVDNPETDGRFDSNTGTGLSSRTIEVTIGADGSATFTVTAADQDADDDGDYKRVQYTVTTGDIDGDGTEEADVTAYVIFADEDPKVEYVSVESNSIQVAPGANGTANNAATVTVRDQYGDPFNNAGIVLLSNNPTADGDADGSTIRSRPLNTGRGGTVRIGYSYSGGAAEETLVAVWDADLTDTKTSVDATGDVTVIGGDKHGHTKVWWVLPYTDDAGTLDGAKVLSIDADNDQIVVDPVENGAVDPTSINYDGNDFFTVIDETGADSVTTPSSMTDFEAAVAEALAGAEGDSPTNVTPTLFFQSYRHDEPSSITAFTLTIPGTS